MKILACVLLMVGGAMMVFFSHQLAVMILLALDRRSCRKKRHVYATDWISGSRWSVITCVRCGHSMRIPAVEDTNIYRSDVEI